eukprot:scaffold4799_cov115-Isochrysis_galbana.AAC.4
MSLDWPLGCPPEAHRSRAGYLHQNLPTFCAAPKTPSHSCSTFDSTECYPNRFGTIDTTHHQSYKLPPRLRLRDRWESLQVTVVHNTFSDRVGLRALTPSLRKRRPEEGEGVGKEWEGGGGVTGRQWTEGVPPTRCR